MPDTGTTGKQEESEIREQSVAIVGENNESLSFASCPTCPGPRRTPTLHVECAPVATTQAGKDADAEVDIKLHASSSSASAQDKGESLQACSCKISQQQLSLEESEREGPVVTDGEDIDATPTQGTGEVALAAPSNPGPSTPVCKGKRKAEADTEDGPVSTAKRNHKPDEVADDKAAYERHWENYIPTKFRDLPDQPGESCVRGLYEQLAAQSPSNLDAIDNPIDVPMDGIESEAIATLVTVFIASFALGAESHEGGSWLTPFTDARHESDPEGVGLDGLDILHRLPGANAEEPSSMDDQEQEF